MIWNQGAWIQTGFTVQSVPLGKSFNIYEIQLSSVLGTQGDSLIPVPALLFQPHVRIK